MTDTAHRTFDNTPMEQNVLRLHDPLFFDPIAYSPYRIHSWNKGYHSADSIQVKNMFLHEACHVIELFMHGKKKRLLQNNFGYSFNGISDSGVRAEAWVIALQQMLSWELFGGVSPTMKYNDVGLLFIERGGVMPPAQFTALTKKAYHEHRAIGSAFYYAKWHEALKYIYNNRNYHHASSFT